MGFLPLIIGVLSVPLTLLFCTYSYFFGLLPVLISIGNQFGVNPAHIAIAMVVRFFVIVHSHVNAKKAEHELLALFTKISIVNRYDLFFNLTQETQYFIVIHK